MGIRIVLLGRVGIDQEGRPVEGGGLPGRRSELVFAYLVAEHGRSVSRDELADALWPDRLPDTWNAALRTVLSDVRRFLERAGLDPAETLVTEHGNLRFRLPGDAVLDLDEARMALASAQDRDDAMAAGRAAELTAQPFLSHHEGAWVDGMRDDLDELHARALELEARLHARAGNPRAGVPAAERLVRADPFDEAAHRLRIELLGAAGDRAGALKAYEHCKALLAAELHITPSPETEAVLEQALAGNEPAPAANGFGAYSVLVVEDHDFQRSTALRLLRGLGVGTLHEAPDGVAALALLETMAPPDVIVCDIDMPNMDGIEFIRHVAERGLAGAVAIASALDRRLLETVRAASEGYGLQVLGAIPKPLTARALEELLLGFHPSRPGLGPDPAGAATAIAALHDGTLVADFEPVVDLGSGVVAGVRAVARVPAAPAAIDAAGLGLSLAEQLLRQAADATQHLDLDIWLTLTPAVLTDLSLVDALAAITRDRVVLVVSATGLARGDRPTMLDVLARLRLKGYGLCVDDAGAPLERLPLTHAQLPAADDPARLQEAVDAARAQELPVVGACATATEYESVLQLGCSYAFGPFLAAPMPADRLAAGVAAFAAPPATADGAR